VDERKPYQTFLGPKNSIQEYTLGPELARDMRYAHGLAPKELFQLPRSRRSRKRSPRLARKTIGRQDGGNERGRRVLTRRAFQGTSQTHRKDPDCCLWRPSFPYIPAVFVWTVGRDDYFFKGWAVDRLLTYLAQGDLQATGHASWMPYQVDVNRPSTVLDTK
jgi:hypothetical protein